MNFLPLRGTIFFFFFFYFSLQGKPFERDERNAMRVYFLFSSRRNEKLCNVGDDISGVDKVIDDGTGGGKFDKFILSSSWKREGKISFVELFY